MLQQLNYYDVSVHLPYPIGDPNKGTEVKFKTPAPDVHSFLFYLDLIGFDLKLIDEINVYEVSSIKGNTRVNYKFKRNIDGGELQSFRATYFRVYKRKLKDKFKQRTPL